ncbi:MAG: energy transducer TonB [Bacteroidales bacterium]|jgi:protein TonB|nr:energy transducer TonB [Bacteroidales bacterium]MCK9448897.1 energy transducer TonB [Bacteroidales bacterium]MDD3700916.1 energy transducer TonB [Bacteroidales bacterium]MDY0370028.1 energy transducer TonB [Bacteroidales bacterium]
MEIKKTPKADLENKKMLFREIGMILALAAIFLAFEYKSYDARTINMEQRVVEDIPEEIVPITEQAAKPPPPPPPQQTTVLSIVQDDVEVEDVEINVEIDQTVAIEAYVPPVREEEEVIEQEIFTVVESMPEFPGGQAKMLEFIATNIKYPPMARESGIQGRVFVNFVVEPDGSVSGVTILRGIGGGCDEEAIRVIQSMPKWTPGRQRGKAVRVSFNLPVRFTLQ